MRRKPPCSLFIDPYDTIFPIDFFFRTALLFLSALIRVKVIPILFGTLLGRVPPDLNRVIVFVKKEVVLGLQQKLEIGCSKDDPDVESNRQLFLSPVISMPIM